LGALIHRTVLHQKNSRSSGRPLPRVARFPSEWRADEDHRAYCTDV
jgi:hypothetical protein